MLTIPGHAAPVKCLAWLKHGEGQFVVDVLFRSACFVCRSTRDNENEFFSSPSHQAVRKAVSAHNLFSSRKSHERVIVLSVGQVSWSE